MLSRHAEHLEDTRNGIVQAARECFATLGYADTSIDEIVARARLTRGALYHHFDSKADVFATVLEQVETEFIERLVAAGAPGATVWESIINGLQAFLDLSLDPEVQQIMLLDGPVVLGWRTWREIEQRHGYGLLGKWLKIAMDHGQLPEQPVEPIANLLSGALNEAVIAIAHAPDRQQAREEFGAALTAILRRLGGPAW